MITLKPLADIRVPEPRPDELYEVALFDRPYAFRGLKALLGAADLSKAGDRLCGLAARDEVEREAARTILSGLTLQHIFDRPLTDDKGQIDSVMRVNYDIDPAVFKTIAPMTLGQLKDFILSKKPAEVAKLSRGITGVMAAALAKLMDVHELVLASKKLINLDSI